MDRTTVARLSLIVGALGLTIGCEYGPFDVQTQSLPAPVQVIVNDPIYLSEDYQQNQWYLETINAAQAWEQYTAIVNSSLGGSAVQTVPVAVIDSGVDGTHEDLIDVLARTGVDLVGGTLTPIPQGMPAEASGIDHGTHVAGLIAARGGNDRGLSGVAYNGWSRPAVTVVPVRALNGLDGSVADVIQGVLFAAGATPGQHVAPARVINMSLGADVNAINQLGEGSILLLESAVEEAYRRGLILVAAAGNGAVPVGSNRLSARAGQSDGIDWPARFPSVIAVGSVDRAEAPQDSQRSYFSDYGLQLELVAPGAESSGEDSINNVGIVSTVSSAADPPYGLEVGTSMAAPLVAGAAALVWSANPHLSGYHVRRILQETALDLGDPGRDEEFGYGLLDVGEALRMASTTPYGRFEEASESQVSEGAPEYGVRYELTRSKWNVEYRRDLPADFIVYLTHGADIDAFGRIATTIRSDAVVKRIGYLPLGSAVKVSVPRSQSDDSSGEAMFAALREDPDVLSLTQDRPASFGDL